MIPVANASYDAENGPARRLVLVDGRWVEDTSMGAMKRLHEEYGRSGWDLSGFPLAERAAWRRLLPESHAPIRKPRPVKPRPVKPVTFDAEAVPDGKPPWE
jgi:hypothetical protein